MSQKEEQRVAELMRPLLIGLVTTCLPWALQSPRANRIGEVGLSVSLILPCPERLSEQRSWGMWQAALTKGSSVNVLLLAAHWVPRWKPFTAHQCRLWSSKIDSYSEPKHCTIQETARG